MCTYTILKVFAYVCLYLCVWNVVFINMYVYIRFLIKKEKKKRKSPSIIQYGVASLSDVIFPAFFGVTSHLSLHNGEKWEKKGWRLPYKRGGSLHVLFVNNIVDAHRYSWTALADSSGMYAYVRVCMYARAHMRVCMCLGIC